MRKRGSDHPIFPAITCIAILIMVARIVSTYRVFNDVVDEPYHIGAGVGMYESGRHTYGVQHPPLPRLVGALPLVLSGVGDPIARDAKPIQRDLTAFEIGHRVLLKGPLPYWTALTRARAAMLVFPITAVIYVYLLGRFLGNRLVGCAAAVMFSTDPTLLGHAAWVTTDVAAAAGYLVATYHGIRLISRPTWRRALAAGIALGVAIACKFSCALVVVPLALIWLTRGRRAWQAPARKIALAIGCAFVAFITLWATYFFDVGRIDDSITFEGRELERLPRWLTSAQIPMPSAFIGGLVLVQHNRLGHFNYFNGVVAERGSWLYFPEAIAIKSPVAMLLGLLLATISMFACKPRRLQRLACILIPGVVFLATCLTSNINIGIRHVLPAIPFIYLFIAVELARGRRAAIAFVLAIVMFVETLSLHPDYLAYFNVLVGGPKNGEKYLLDSNLDWGQDRARLKDWLEANAVQRVVTSRLFGNPRLYQWPHEGFDLAPPNTPPRDIFAISKNYAHDVYPSPMPMSGVRELKPIAQIGYSIEVYDLTLPGSSAQSWPRSTSDRSPE